MFVDVNVKVFILVVKNILHSVRQFIYSNQTYYFSHHIQLVPGFGAVQWSGARTRTHQVHRLAAQNAPGHQGKQSNAIHGESKRVDPVVSCRLIFTVVQISNACRESRDNRFYILLLWPSHDRYVTGIASLPFFEIPQPLHLSLSGQADL